MTALLSENSIARVLRANPYWIAGLHKHLPVENNLSVPRSEAEAIKAIAEADRTRDLPRAANLIFELLDREIARGDQRPSAVTTLARAVHFFIQARDPASALQAMEKRLPQLVESPQRALVAGLVQLSNRNIATGVDWLQRAVELDPQLGPAWASLAVIFALARDHARAEHAARQALRYGEQGHINIVNFVLMQSTLEQGHKPEGVYLFDGPSDSEAELQKVLEQLPPVRQADLVQQHKLPVVFVGVDHQYFVDYAIPLVLSIAQSQSACGVHLHVMNPGRDFAALVHRLRAAVPGLPLQISTESVHVEQYLAAVTYYSGIRYCRLHQLMQANDQPVIMIDADALVRGDLATLPGFQDPQIDLALPYYPDEPIWQEIAAGITYFKPTAASRAFLADVASFIAHNLARGAARWYVDQLALYLAWKKHRDRACIELLDGSTIIDTKHHDDSLVWFVTGDKKAAAQFTRRQQELLAARPSLQSAPPQEHQREVVTTRHGQMLIWADDLYIGRSLKARGSWCQHELDLLQRFVKPGYTVVDVGANVGSHTLAFSQWVGSAGLVVAFEPQSAVYQVLMANLGLNRIANTQAYQRGLADRAGVRYTQFIAEPNHYGAVALLPDMPSAHFEEVQVLALDDLNLDACHLIKMDIEGMEYEALQGARRTIERHLPVLHLENHPSSPHFRDVIDLVRGWGYQIFDHGLKTTNPNLLCLPAYYLDLVPGLEPLKL